MLKLRTTQPALAALLASKLSASHPTRAMAQHKGVSRHLLTHAFDGSPDIDAKFAPLK